MTWAIIAGSLLALLVLRVWRETAAYNRAWREERESFQATVQDFERRP